MPMRRLSSARCSRVPKECRSAEQEARITAILHSSSGKRKRKKRRKRKVPKSYSSLSSGVRGSILHVLVHVVGLRVRIVILVAFASLVLPRCDFPREQKSLFSGFHVPHCSWWELL